METTTPELETERRRASLIRRRSQRRRSKISTTAARLAGDRKSTRLNSSHANISYAVFCLKKKNKTPSCPRHIPPPPFFRPISAALTSPPSLFLCPSIGIPPPSIVYLLQPTSRPSPTLPLS